MNNKDKTLSRIIQVAVWPVILVLIFIWYRGFFRPDPYVMARYAPFSTGLLWSLRIGIPLVIAYISGLVWGLQTRRMSLANTSTLIGSLVLCGLVGFAVIHHKYQKTMGSFSNFHPYLQINPPSIPVLNDSEYNILFLGGSTTEFKDSHGVGWPERVEILMNDSLQRKDIRCFNLGKQWYTTQHSMIYYATSLRKIRPDAIVVMHTINDLLHNADFSYFSHGPYRRDYGHFDGPVHRIVQPQGFFTFLGWMTRSMWYHGPRDTIYTDEFPGVVSFHQNLSTLLDLTETDHVPVVLMTQPNLYKENMTAEEMETLYMLRFEAIGPDQIWDVRTAAGGFSQYRKTVLSFESSRHVPVIDLENTVPKTLDCFTDDVHYTDCAFDRIGESVARELIEQLHLKK
ncbi:SGNH/GDSL hydrolase family protein [bacterium]|nr:SGNH/GDSL hydrolase family protein [bacterium]